MSNPTIIPCCLSDPCIESPLVGLSAEQVDGVDFLSANFGGQDAPPVGSNWKNTPFGGPAFCLSTVSQLDADQCAQRSQVVGGPGNWTLPGGNPQPLFLNSRQSYTAFCPDNLPFQFVVPAGAYMGVTQDEADDIALSWAIKLGTINAVCLSVGTLSPNACANQPYSSTVSATGPTPFVFTVVNGSLPPGLALYATDSTFSIAGVPTVPGSYVFSIRATAVNQSYMQKTFSIGVLGILNPSTLSFTTNHAFSTQLNGVGGFGPYTFSLAFGALPTGLALSSSGLISGTPTAISPVTPDAVVINMTDTGTGVTCSFRLTFALNFTFQNMVWGTPVQNAGPPPPNGTFFNFSGVTNTFDLNIDSPPITGAGYAVTGTIHGWTGPSTAANLAVGVINTLGNCPDINTDIVVSLNGTPILTVPSANLCASGSTNYPFTIPAANNATLTVFMQIFRGNPFLEMAVEWAGILSPN